MPSTYPLLREYMTSPTLESAGIRFIKPAMARSLCVLLRMRTERLMSTSREFLLRAVTRFTDV